MLGRMFRPNPQNMRGMRVRKQANLLNKVNPGEFQKFLKEGGNGFNKVIYEKLNFFHIKNAFIGFSIFKFGWALMNSDTLKRQFKEDRQSA